MHFERSLLAIDGTDGGGGPLFWDPIPKNVAICFFLDHILCESTEDEIKLLNNQLGKELQLYQSGLMHVLGNCGQSTPLLRLSMGMAVVGFGVQSDEDGYEPIK